jgi:hypothetical protein
LYIEGFQWGNNTQFGRIRLIYCFRKIHEKLIVFKLSLKNIEDLIFLEYFLARKD